MAGLLACTATACVENLVIDCRFDADCTGLSRTYSRCNVRVGHCEPERMHHTSPQPDMVDVAASDGKVLWLSGRDCGSDAYVTLFATTPHREVRWNALAPSLSVLAKHSGHHPLAMTAAGDAAWVLHQSCGQSDAPVEIGRVDGLRGGLDAGPAPELAQVTQGTVALAHPLDGELWCLRQGAQYADVLVISESGVLSSTICRRTASDGIVASHTSSAGVLWADASGVKLSTAFRGTDCLGRDNPTFTPIRAMGGGHHTTHVASHGDHLAWATASDTLTVSSDPVVEHALASDPAVVHTHHIRGAVSALLADADGLFWVEEGDPAQIMSWDWDEAEPTALATSTTMRGHALASNSSRVFWMEAPRPLEAGRGSLVVSALKRQAYADR